MSDVADRATDPMLSVIISSYNTRDVLRDCLQSLYRNPPSTPYEVIVVDDASTDGTSEMVRAEFPGVRLLVNETNRLFAYSNNRAFDAARGQYFFQLNSDTIVLPRALDTMLTFLEEHPEAGSVGCKLLNEDGTTQGSAKTYPNLVAALFGVRSIVTMLFPNNPYSRKRMLHLTHDMTAPFQVDGYLSSAALMMPAKVVKEIGHLDERLFYHGDTDYCKRLDDAGYASYYVPTVSIIHLNHRGGSMKNLRARYRSLFLYHWQSYLYYRKHVTKSAVSPIAIIVLLGLAGHYLASAFLQAGVELAGAVRLRLQPGSSAS